MFRRRNPLSVLQRMRAVMWPKRGFSRLVGYLVQRVLRLPGTPYSIACGVACGAAISFTPFLGLHLILSAAICYPLGGNWIAAWIGTAIGNPWTIPLFLVTARGIGNAILSYVGFEVPLNFTGQLEEYNQFLSMLIPTTIGGSLMAIFVWPFFYGVTYYTIIKWRSHRKTRILKKAGVHPSAHESKNPSHHEGL